MTRPSIPFAGVAALRLNEIPDDVTVIGIPGHNSIALDLPDFRFNSFPYLYDLNHTVDPKTGLATFNCSPKGGSQGGLEGARYIPGLGFDKKASFGIGVASKAVLTVSQCESVTVDGVEIVVVAPGEGKIHLKTPTQVIFAPLDNEDHGWPEVTSDASVRVFGRGTVDGDSVERAPEKARVPVAGLGVKSEALTL